MSAANRNAVFLRRVTRGWSQAELARRAGISRTAVSAIEGEHLTPSVTTALSLAEVLECPVEELFGHKRAHPAQGPEWAWERAASTGRYWEAEVNRRARLFPVEAISLNPIPHDGVSKPGIRHKTNRGLTESTLVLACCDPASGLLAAEYARASGFRLLVFPRGGSAALDLLKRGLVHLAGLHCSTAEHPERNAGLVREKLGAGYQLLRIAQWEEGVAVPAFERSLSARSMAKRPCRWALRERGSAARECLDELLAGRRVSGRTVASHAEVAQAVQAGWAGAGICVRLCASEAGLNFLSVRTEALDLCLSGAMIHDPRIQALIRLLRSRTYRQVIGDLPGYNTSECGELKIVSVPADQTN